MNLKESKKENTEVLEMRNVKGERCKYTIIPKTKRSNFQSFNG